MLESDFFRVQPDIPVSDNVLVCRTDTDILPAYCLAFVSSVADSVYLQGDKSDRSHIVPDISTSHPLIHVRIELPIASIRALFHALFLKAVRAEGFQFKE